MNQIILICNKCTKLNFSTNTSGTLLYFVLLYCLLKVANAAAHGAEGAILYADPAEYAQEGMDSNKVYPQTSWLPEKAILFGSAYARAGGGDPLTPDIPALEGMYRQFFNQSDIPKIPAQTISYEAAKVLLEAINTGGKNISNKF